MSILFHIFVILIFTSCTNCSISIDDHCNLVLRHHPVVKGIGVFAGKRYEKGEVVESCITLEFDDKISKYTILDDYTYASSVPGWSALALGYAPLYNHIAEEDKSVTMYNAEGLSVSLRTNNETSDYFVIAERDIEIGDEIFASYGTESWFHERNIPYSNSDAIMSANGSSEFRDLPGCVLQTTAIIGGRIYATQKIEKDSIVEVSRAILVPDAFASNQTLDKYAWHEEHGERGMIVLGHGALYRAVSVSPSLEDYNVLYAWYEYDDKPFYWEDLERESIALVKFTAVKDIDVDEELIIPMIIDPVTKRRRVFNRQLPIEDKNWDTPTDSYADDSEL